METGVLRVKYNLNNMHNTSATITTNNKLQIEQNQCVRQLVTHWN